MRISILLLAASSVFATIPVRDGCDSDSILVANVQEADPIQVRHGVMGESTPCYAVSVSQAGKEVQGYILGNSLPAIQEFERKRALESRIGIPPPPPVPAGAKAPLPPPTGVRFDEWSGVSTEGRRMQIAPGTGKATLVTFWSAQSGAARHFVQRLEPMESEFRMKGLKSFGFVGGVDRARANYYMDDMSLTAPQALDVQKLAAKYNADAAKGTTLVLDGSNNVIITSSNLAEIRAVVASLLSSK